MAKPKAKRVKEQKNSSEETKNGFNNISNPPFKENLVPKSFLLIISLLVAAISYVYVMNGTTTPKQTQQLLPSFNIVAAVTTKTLSSQTSKFAQSCAEADIPIILKNSIATQWKARHWTPEYLETKIRMMTGVYENTNRWFGPYFDEQKPLFNYVKRVNKYKTNLKLPAMEFFNRIHSAHTSNEYLYFTGDIDQLGDWAIHEIEPFRELLTLNPSHSSINAWIGQPHVIAHCHYDGYHNFYAQLYGTKRFLLLKPNNWPGLYPYPFLHPSHAQAQVNVSDERDWQNFPLVERVEAYEAILEPGDLLYIPPLWFHEVESLDVSISVNVWTDSIQTEIAERLFQLELPIHLIKWSSDRVKMIATSFLLFQALQMICTNQNCVRCISDKFNDGLISHNSPLSNTGAIYFMHRLWSTRYRTLMETGKLPKTLPTGSPTLCEEEALGSIDEELDEAKLASHSNEFVQYAQRVGKLVQELSEDTWELWAGNYVEFVVANAVTDVEYVGVFLKHFDSCLLVTRE